MYAKNVVCIANLIETLGSNSLTIMVQVASTTSQDGPELWHSVSKWLPSRDVDKDFWWNLCGHHLFTMLDAGGYTVEKQYEALMFFYHYVVRKVFAL